MIVLGVLKIEEEVLIIPKHIKIVLEVQNVFSSKESLPEFLQLFKVENIPKINDFAAKLDMEYLQRTFPAALACLTFAD